MSEKMIVRYCAPTLAGLKTGAIFNCAYDSAEALRSWLRDINRRLSRKGLRVLPLKKEKGVAMIYVYRPDKLKSDILQEEAAKLLSEYGYVHTMPLHCVKHLIERLGEGKEFPHEIGLFLGYPPEDVRGFIENGARASKCVGHWKVYGDEEKAKKTFSLYKKCTSVYMRRLSMGSSIERLAVG
ncbi:MAG: DUF3793 family protein [Clostridia bacterium]|nr:DUF3793 family protein [Clostridia bacterium]